MRMYSQVKRINRRSAELAKEVCREVEIETGKVSPHVVQGGGVGA